MASLREIRRKIKSVRSTQQITKAMKMVAAARLRKAQARIMAARPFAQKMEGLIVDLLSVVELSEPNPLFVKRQAGRRILCIVTSDRGLCGGFNTNLIRAAILYLRHHGPANVDLYIVGRKGRDYFRRVHASVLKEYVGMAGPLSFAQAELLAADLTDAYVSQEVVAVDILYNEFKSIIQQKIITKPLLPLPAPAVGRTVQWPEFIYEPGREVLVAGLVPRYIKAIVFRILLESAAAELGARMAAMENATANAKSLIQSLTLQMNRTRQAAITNQILEVVSGAEALR